MFRYGLLPCALLAITSSAFAALDGTIRNERGVPLGNVTVGAFRGGYAITTTKTDSHGHFRLLTFPPVVAFIEHEGYEPQASLIDGSEHVKLILLDHTGRRWEIPQCADDQAKRVAWGPLRFEFPSDGSTRRSTDIDYERIVVAYGATPEVLVVWSGLSASNGFPTGPAWLREKARITARSIAFRGSVGIDMRTALNDGRVSRWFGTATNFARYESVSREAAILFDNIIESACSK